MFSGCGKENGGPFRSRLVKPRIPSELPAESESDREKIRMTIVGEKHPVITSLGIKLHMPLRPECDSHSAVDSRLVQGVFRDHLIRRNCHRVITAVGIK